IDWLDARRPAVGATIAAIGGRPRGHASGREKRPSLQTYNAPVATLQGLFAATRQLSAAGESFRVDIEIVEPLAQRVAVDAEQLRRAQLVAPGFAQRVLEQRPLERSQGIVIESPRSHRRTAQPCRQRAREVRAGR